MKFIVALLISSLFASIVDDINNDPTSTWWAKEYPPEVITLEKMRARLIRPYRAHRGNTLVGRLIKADDSFDARDKWGDLILPVRDQASCGSCWAFAVAETTGDRVGIEGLVSAVYSPQDLVSCDTNDYGCSGGYIDLSWEYVLNNGLALDACIPYVSGDGSEPPCPKACTSDNSTIVRTKATKVYPNPYENMQDDLQTNGPFEVGFEVYSDFMNYAGGVYQHKSGYLEGGHAVLVIGWGVLDGTPYWLVQNSWGTSWGLDGYFLILRGNDECGIEDDGYAGVFV